MRAVGSTVEQCPAARWSNARSMPAVCRRTVPYVARAAKRVGVWSLRLRSMRGSAVNTAIPSFSIQPFRPVFPYLLRTSKAKNASKCSLRLLGQGAVTATLLTDRCAESSARMQCHGFLNAIPSHFHRCADHPTTPYHPEPWRTRWFGWSWFDKHRPPTCDPWARGLGPPWGRHRPAPRCYTLELVLGRC